MIYSEEQYNALEQKAVNHILARDNKIDQQADRIKELETALRYIERKGHLNGSTAARVARAALRDFTISGTRSALGGDA